MSTIEEDTFLGAYTTTINCYEQLKSAFDQSKFGDYDEIMQLLKQCLFNVDYLISIEKDDDEFFIPLIQIKQKATTLIQDIEDKQRSALNREPTNKTPSAINLARKGSYDEKKNSKLNKGHVEKKTKEIMESIETVPLVDGLCSIAGMPEVKKMLKSLIILPQTQPQLFQDRKFCNTILLYGPPGTGKTRLVHALAAQANAKLYSISAGNILSSYIGQTEEAIQNIFKYIKNSTEYSIIFIDEVDGLCRKRTGNEYEYSRRIKTEMMCQLSQVENYNHVYVICATNCPWDLDTAILRRFQRQIYVPLPNRIDRMELLKMFLKDTFFEISLDMWSKVLDHTEGYSGSDLSAIVKYALNLPLIELEDAFVWKSCVDGYFEPISNAADATDNLIVCRHLDELPPNSVRARQLQMNDLSMAIVAVQPTVSKDDIAKFETYNIK